MRRLLMDFGGTGYRYRIVSEEGDILKSREESSGGITLETLLKELLGEHPEITHAAVSFAGQVDDGVILSSPNSAQGRADLVRSIAEPFGIDLRIENDLKSAALAEYHHAEGVRSLFAAYIGTGFGGAYIEEGALLRGGGNLAGEIGHIPFEPAPFRCGCGGDSCVELYCSGSGLARWVKHEGLDCEATLEALEAESGPQAQQIVERFYAALLHAVATVTALFNPEVIVFGGGVVRHHPRLVEYADEHIRGRAFGPALENLSIRRSHLTNGSLEGTLWL